MSFCGPKARDGGGGGNITDLRPINILCVCIYARISRGRLSAPELWVLFLGLPLDRRYYGTVKTNKIRHKMLRPFWIIFF